MAHACSWAQKGAVHRALERTEKTIQGLIVLQVQVPSDSAGPPTTHNSHNEALQLFAGAQSSSGGSYVPQTSSTDTVLDSSATGSMSGGGPAVSPMPRSTPKHAAGRNHRNSMYELPWVPPFTATKELVLRKLMSQANVNLTRKDMCIRADAPLSPFPA